MVNVMPLIRRLASRDMVTVRFRKKDGTFRTMRCALRDGQVNRYTITAWDLEKDEYRNIPKARIIWYE